MHAGINRTPLPSEQRNICNIQHQGSPKVKMEDTYKGGQIQTDELVMVAVGKQQKKTAVTQEATETSGTREAGQTPRFQAAETRDPQTSRPVAQDLSWKQETVLTASVVAESPTWESLRLLSASDRTSSRVRVKMWTEAGHLRPNGQLQFAPSPHPPPHTPTPPPSSIPHILTSADVHSPPPVVSHQESGAQPIRRREEAPGEVCRGVTGSCSELRSSGGSLTDHSLPELAHSDGLTEDMEPVEQVSSAGRRKRRRPSPGSGRVIFILHLHPLILHPLVLILFSAGTQLRCISGTPRTRSPAALLSLPLGSAENLRLMEEETSVRSNLHHCGETSDLDLHNKTDLQGKKNLQCYYL
ncbi:unnamed protein product [Pleuronectes platessa]|uniref:Uncharacterized protein n=1 Tax=Pleuronectes platessa TaxID=8262 RepID=A0A9N7UNJ9_PLEPL|nr:unnamed protein product [Pleuronectes platessa]